MTGDVILTVHGIFQVTRNTARTTGVIGTLCDSFDSDWYPDTLIRWNDIYEYGVLNDKKYKFY